MLMNDQVYTIEIHSLGGKVESRPCYTCGHCSNIVIMRGDRLRPRTPCLGCGRLTCEQSEICQTYCTPIHRLADNGEMGDAKWGKFIPAIMSGVTSVKEAEQKGLINVKE